MQIVAVFNTEPGRGFWRYTDDHVRSLRNQFARFGHQITIIGQDEPIVERGFGGMWSKMLIFSPAYKHLRPMLAFDLDNFIIGNPAPLLALDPHKLWMIRQFLSRTDLAEMGICTVPESPMSDIVWEKITRNELANTTPGAYLRRFDHEFMVDIVDGIYSYKKHCRNRCPDDARAVLFHGKPKPPDITGWALEWWQTSLISPTKSCSKP